MVPLLPGYFQIKSVLLVEYAVRTTINDQVGWHVKRVLLVLVSKWGHVWRRNGLWEEVG